MYNLRNSCNLVINNVLFSWQNQSGIAENTILHFGDWREICNVSKLVAR